VVKYWINAGLSTLSGGKKAKSS